MPHEGLIYPATIFSGSIRMALHLLPIDDVRIACRQRLDSCEMWLRRLAHDKLNATYGADYVQSACMENQPIFPNECRKRCATRVATSPARYPRPVDALLLDDLAALIGKENVFKSFFAPCFNSEFPLGRMQVHLTISRLVPIRNALSHANPIGQHDMERALCYSNDLIKSIASYYESIGMQQEFNAPSFVRFSDSLGNLLQIAKPEQNLDLTLSSTLRPGSYLRCEVEVDSSFEMAEYTVRWTVHAPPIQSFEGSAFSFMLENRHVGEVLLISAHVTSTKLWHRFRGHDAVLNILYRVLPPI